MTIDLVAVAAEYNWTLGSSFRIKFQQYDNSPLPADGLGFDEIAILAPALLDDWYSFTLHDGQAAAIAVQQLSAGSLDLTLYDSAGGLLRTSIAGANVTRRIDGLVDVTNDGLPDRYDVRVNGLDTRYSLFVTRDAVFDSGRTSRWPGAGSGGAAAVGYVDYEGDVVVEPDAASVGMILDTFFPDVTLSNQITGGAFTLRKRRLRCRPGRSSLLPASSPRPAGRRATCSVRILPVPRRGYRSTSDRTTRGTSRIFAPTTARASCWRN